LEGPSGLEKAGTKKQAAPVVRRRPVYKPADLLSNREAPPFPGKPIGLPPWGKPFRIDRLGEIIQLDTDLSTRKRFSWQGLSPGKPFSIVPGYRSAKMIEKKYTGV
jgi:hypothetical protein